MTGHPNTVKYLQKENLVCSPHVWMEPMIEQILIIEVEEKPCYSSASMVWWHGYRDAEVFQNNYPGDTKKNGTDKNWY